NLLSVPAVLGGRPVTRFSIRPVGDLVERFNSQPHLTSGPEKGTRRQNGRGSQNPCGRRCVRFGHAASFNKALSGMTPNSTYLHSAISSLRPRARIPTLRILLPPRAKHFRYHRLSALCG